ncbi:MAG: hypothetical protein IKV73_08945, partial [Clostridia bacterium]|nr:hypothetical protein [Clostridia bacterium]
MIFKKCTSLILLCTLLMSLFALTPSAASADGSTVDTSQYGISVANAYQSFVVVLPDSIAVFSSTNDAISSADLASAISASGYTVSYAAENGGADATTDVIYGGYVKLTPSSEGEAVYIPIVIKAPMNDTSFASMTQPGAVQNVSYSSTGTPVGGKTTPSPTFTVTGTPSGYTAFKSSSLLKYNASLPTVWTYEFNIYADGAAVPMISLKYADDYGAYIGLKWLADGTLSGYRGGAATVFNFGTMERGKWHRVAISFAGATSGTLSNGRYNLYVDGAYVNNMYNYSCNYAGDHMLFSVHKDSGAGTVAFDDLDAYAGAFEKNG